MKLTRSFTSLAATAFVLMAIVLGCSSSGADCVANAPHHVEEVAGKDKTAEQANHRDCNHYCREADPQYDAMYRIWLDSPKGKAAGSPSKQEAIFKDKDLLTYVTETCAKKCAATMNPQAQCK